VSTIGRRYLIGGRVQGVGFRYFTEAAGARERISGWVRNLPDGRVEVLAQGEPDAIARFEAQIREGPPHARVGEFLVTETAVAVLDGSFTVR
jgi:acylphosphatase